VYIGKAVIGSSDFFVTGSAINLGAFVIYLLT